MAPTDNGKDRPKKPLKHVCFADIDGREQLLSRTSGVLTLCAISTPW